jgi:SecDF, P1 head subdomain
MREETAKKREVTRADVFYRLVPALLLVLGFFFIAVFLFDLTWGFILKRDIFIHRSFSFWILIFPASYNPVYLIIGVVFSLIGVHLRNDRSWNRYRVILQVMCVLLAVVALLQIVSLAMLANHSFIWDQRSTLLSLYVMLSVTFIALLAIAIIEMPGVLGYMEKRLQKRGVPYPPDEATLEERRLPGLEPTESSGGGLWARFPRLLPAGLIALAVVLVGVMVAAAVTTHEPKARYKKIALFYEGNADKNEQRTTERDLNKRLEKAGYGFVYVVLGPYGQAEIAGDEGYALFLAPLLKKGEVQARLVESREKWASSDLAFSIEQNNLDKSTAEPNTPIRRAVTNYPGKDRYILNMGPSILDNKSIANAKTRFDFDWNTETVMVDFKPEAARQLKELAVKNRGKWLALLVDGVVKAVIPLDNDAARGRFQTRPLSSSMEANNLAAYLTAGPLPLKIVYEPEGPN